MDGIDRITLTAFIQIALSGHDYILQSQILIFTYDELHNTSSIPCVNVTILDDDIPENDLYINIGLSVDSAVIFPGKNHTIIKILDNDHGMIHHYTNYLHYDHF